MVLDIANYVVSCVSVMVSCQCNFLYLMCNIIIPFSLSIRSLRSAASSANFEEVFTPSPDFWVFSIIAQARNTKAGTVSAFSWRGISTRDQYWVSRRMTSWNVYIVYIMSIFWNIYWFRYIHKNWDGINKNKQCQNIMNNFVRFLTVFLLS